MSEFKVAILECSKDVSVKERIKLKDTQSMYKLDRETQQHGDIKIDVDYYAMLDVHNDKADPQDYKNYVVVSKGGDYYVTGSESFYRAFKSITDELEEAGVDDYQIVVTRRPSKNREGKDFLTCSLV